MVALPPMRSRAMRGGKPDSHPHSGAGMVRLIGGRWRGSRLPVVDLAGLRPTADRVRETVFNWLQPKLPGARVLDLFAGSGALGFEAVSRGACQALLVERNPRQAQTLKAIAERLRAGPAVEVVCADALAWLRAPLHGRFDLVFVDPPFMSGSGAAALAALAPWLAPDAWLYLETSLVQPLAPDARWRLHRQGQTRQVRYALYTCTARVGEGAATLLQPHDLPVVASG